MTSATPTAAPSSPWQPRPEHELVPYHPASLQGLRRILVLAPHPDDEVFGCGGLIALAVEQGVQVSVVVVSDGAAGGHAALREQESRAAAQALGYLHDHAALRFWRLPDRGVRPDDALVARIRAAVDERGADWLLAPSPFEVHPDHLAVCQAATTAALHGAARLVYYEVGQPLMANLLVDVSAVTPRKHAAMRCFASQLQQQDYGEHIAALNRYRAYTLGPAVTHAEAFRLASAGASVQDTIAETAQALAGRWPRAAESAGSAGSAGSADTSGPVSAAGAG